MSSFQLVDTHCHLHSFNTSSLVEDRSQTRSLWLKSKKTIPEILNDAKKESVTKLICVGCDFWDSQLAVDFANEHSSQCWASIGIHPHEAQKHLNNKGLLDKFIKLIDNPKTIAIGECGLDYFYNHSPKQAQIKILEFQLNIAQKHNLPVIFHVREAFDDFWPIFDNFNNSPQPIRGVLHSFTDNLQNLHKALERDLYIGVNGIATFTKSPAQLEVYRAIPSDKILFETDSPFLTPVPYRGTINESKYISVIAEFMSSLRNEDIKLLALQTTNNAQNLFGLIKD